MTYLDTLKKQAQEMVSGRELVPKITSSATIVKLKRDAELGDSILAMLAVIEAAKAMREWMNPNGPSAKAFDAALAELEEDQ